MPDNTIGHCPYCGCDVFYAGVTIEVTPFNAAVPEGRWWNKCRGCDQWSQNVIQPDGTSLQVQIDESQWPG